MKRKCIVFAVTCMTICLLTTLISFANGMASQTDKTADSNIPAEQTGGIVDSFYKSRLFPPDQLLFGLSARCGGGQTPPQGFIALGTTATANIGLGYWTNAEGERAPIPGGISGYTWLAIGGYEVYINLIQTNKNYWFYNCGTVLPDGWNRPDRSGFLQKQYPWP